MKTERWKKTCPKKAGIYLFRCLEGGFEKVEMVVAPIPQDSTGKLWVNCRDTGQHPVEVFHYNLCDPSWKLISLSK